MRFIDLFHGLGGFHIGLTNLGHECVFACDIDPELRDLYDANFGIKSSSDIRNVAAEDILKHDILCAGFPCQPYSKAGSQHGLECPKWGDLFFDHVLRIANYHQPTYLILENVPNLEKHDEGRTWSKIITKLSASYDVSYKRLSPHQFGIPHNRERIFIVAARNGLGNFKWPLESKQPSSINTILDHDPIDVRNIPEQVIRCINVWQEFIDAYPSNIELPSFPIWSAEFGATYPYEKEAPLRLEPDVLRQYRGSHGVELHELPLAHMEEKLPSYARRPQNEFPEWKKTFIRQNRQLYKQNSDWLDTWLPKILEFPPSLQKLEWNCKGEIRDISKYILQVRASGLRVKRTNAAPSLVAMTSTQVPIIGWESRYMTARECARLQSLESLTSLPTSNTRTFRALGNAVNASLVQRIAESLLQPHDLLNESNPEGSFALSAA